MFTNNLTIKELEETDRVDIGLALVQAFKSGRTTKNWLNIYTEQDRDRVVDNIYNNTKSCIVNNTYLLCYDVCETWFGNDIILNENMVLKIRQSQESFDCVLQALEVLAKSNNCVGITTATALTKDDQKLKDKYKGFEVYSLKLFKEV